MSTSLTVLIALLVSLAFSLLLAVPGALVLALLFGALHDSFGPSVPQLGYAACYPIALFTFWFWNLLTATSAGGGND